MFAVGDDRLRRAVDVLGSRSRQAVERGPRVVPHPGPEHEGHVACATGEVDGRQHQLPVERLDDRVIAARAELEQKTGHDCLARNPVAAQLDPAELAGFDERELAVPVTLALVGEEVEVHFHPPRELLVEPPAVVRGEVVDEGDAAPHRRCQSSVDATAGTPLCAGSSDKQGVTAGRSSVPLLERMCGALEHRGPDSRGLHVAPASGLGSSGCA